ncbi:hypothetical protein CGRA01v4_02251 [Colletotrichum graminicola]|nr:hypothetical protein CGRA01v4_02251 [Colletotrichum graminicola]
MTRPQPGFVRSIIPWSYANSAPVKEELDRRLGVNRYRLSVCNLCTLPLLSYAYILKDSAWTVCSRCYSQAWLN